MKIKHTQGEWQVNDEGENGIFINTKENSAALARLYLQNAVIQERSEAEANARLIAAAPELLEQLQNMINAFKTFASQAQYKAGVFMAEEAIKKATYEN